MVVVSMSKILSTRSVSSFYDDYLCCMHQKRIPAVTTFQDTRWLRIYSPTIYLVLILVLYVIGALPCYGRTSDSSKHGKSALPRLLMSRADNYHLPLIWVVCRVT